MEILKEEREFELFDKAPKYKDDVVGVDGIKEEHYVYPWRFVNDKAVLRYCGTLDDLENCVTEYFKKYGHETELNGKDIVVPLDDSIVIERQDKDTMYRPVNKPGFKGKFSQVYTLGQAKKIIDQLRSTEEQDVAKLIKHYNFSKKSEALTEDVVKVEAGKTYTITGIQDNPYGGRNRTRYAGVNDHGGACVITMGERRSWSNRVYFIDLAEAKEFFIKFEEKFSKRGNVKFAIKKVSANNPANGHELVKDDSDCGSFYHISTSQYGHDATVPHGVKPDSNGNVSWERDKEEVNNESLDEDSDHQARIDRIKAAGERISANHKPMRKKDYIDAIINEIYNSPEAKETLRKILNSFKWDEIDHALDQYFNWDDDAKHEFLHKIKEAN